MAGTTATTSKTAGAALALAFAFASSPVRAAQLPPEPPASQTFEVGSLLVQQYGSGSRTLVLVPGLAAGPWSWYGTIARFAPGYTIYSLTLDGFNGRPYTANPPLFDAFARDFWTLLNSRKIDRPVVVGHSLGGTLALYLAEQHPERLRGVVALDGMPVFPPFANLSAAQRIAAADQTAATAAAWTPAQELAAETDYMKTIGVLDDALAEQTGALEARASARAFAQWFKEDGEADLRPQLSAITVPVLEISPYNPPDYARPPLQLSEDQKVEFYRNLLAGAPHAQVVSISPARHFAMLDQPDKFYAILVQFLSTLP